MKSAVISLLFRTFELRSKVLPFGNTQINLVFRSLIRTFAPAIYKYNKVRRIWNTSFWPFTTSYTR